MSCSTVSGDPAVAQMASNGGRIDLDCVLVVDDDPRVRAGLRALIEASSLHVTVAEAASPAEAMAMAVSPGVVLCDVLLPAAADGLDVIAALASNPHRTVLAMSSRSEFRGAALSAGARAFFDKGTAPEALLAVLADSRQQPA